MARSARIVEPGLPHHVVLKGVAGCAIFVDEFDRQTFVRLLAFALRKFGARCLAWCLVGNHLHLIIVPERHPLARVIHCIATRYAQTFNWRHARVGHLFQNRYWSRVIQGDDYLLNALAYVPLNVVKAGLVPGLDALQTYPYSSYAALMGRRDDSVTDVAGVLSLFDPDVAVARHSLHRLMDSRLAMWSQNPAWHWGDAPDALPGTAGWIDERTLVLERSRASAAAAGAWDETRLRAERLRADGWTPEGLLASVCAASGVAVAELRSRSRRPAVSRARALFVFLSNDALLVPFAASARMLGIDESSTRRAARIGAVVAQQTQVTMETLPRVADPVS